MPCWAASGRRQRTLTDATGLNDREPALEEDARSAQYGEQINRGGFGNERLRSEVDNSRRHGRSRSEGEEAEVAVVGDDNARLGSRRLQNRYVRLAD